MLKLGRKLTRLHFNQKLGMVACTCHPGYKHKKEDRSSGCSGHKRKTLFKKYLKQKGLRPQVVEHLSNCCKVLSARGGAVIAAQ
jgi:hypothetical protein